MQFLKTILTGICSLAITTSFSQDNLKADCSILKSGKFKYLDAEDSTGYIIMEGDKQTDRSEKNEYIIESTIKWTSDCSYKMIMTKITIPNFLYKPGDVMKVDIDKIEGDIIYYTSTVKGTSWKGRFRIMSN